MPQTNESKDIWLNQCREYYHGDEIELKKIEIFSKEYKSDEAIRWYTEESFVYRLVNRAFRIDDITLWYLSRYYIADMCRQMEIIYREQNCTKNFILYRRQRTSIHELESIKELAESNHLFCTTAFFSTTKNFDVSTLFGSEIGDPNNDEIISVLFEIIVDSINLKTIIFVDINQYLLEKYHMSNDEDEVLFTIGSIFQITSIKEDRSNSKLWRICMKATDDGADLVQYHLNLMRNKYKNMKINLLFGRYLLDMNYLSKAESYFQMLLHECSNSNQYYDEDLLFINDSLGELHMRTTNYNQAYQYFQNAHRIRLKNPTLTNIFISYIYFGNYYKTINDFNQAYQYYMKALLKMNENISKHKINIERVYINIASINAHHREYYKALELCLKIENSFKNIHLTYPLYSEMIICQGLIGDIYFAREDYDQAEKFYLNVFHMCQKYLCIGDKQFIHCIYSLIELYRRKLNDNNQYALNFCEKQLELHRKHFSFNHLSIAYLLIKLGHIKQDIHSYQKALEILFHYDYLEYLTIAQCYQSIGD
jgi:tetratricopeptide (TPR) repeat protein